MLGPMQKVNAQVAAVNFDVSRLLNRPYYKGLLFGKPDAVDGSGMTIIRAYTKAYDRIPEAEENKREGRTVVVDIADVFVAGQLETDVREAEFIGLQIGPAIETDVEWYKLNGSPTANPDDGVYRLTCGTRTFKRTYFRVGAR